MKVVILGGSSLSTPALFACLGAIPALPELSFVLVGRNSARLSANRRAAEMLLAGAPVGLETVSCGEQWQKAVEGSDLVLVQVRIGGYPGRSWDETFPLKFGIVGDEGLGPGGLSAAYRAWPVIEGLLQRVQEVVPTAFVLLLSSPVGLLVQATLARFSAMRVAGVCELPWTTLREICNSLGLSVRGVDYDYFGLNHLGWFHRIVFGSRDLVFDYARFRSSIEEFPSSDLIMRAAAIPTRYLRLHYQPDLALGEQCRRTKSRGEQLQDLSQEAVKIYAQGSRPEIDEALRRRPASWYAEAVVPFILGLCTWENGFPLFLSVPNRGYVPSLGDDDIVEIPHSFHSGRLERRKLLSDVPSHVMEITERFAAFERVATRALLKEDPSLIRQALEIHPWVRDQSKADAIAAEILAQRLP